MTQITYVRRNLHNQVKLSKSVHFHDHRLFPLQYAKSLFKIHFRHKTLICSAIFKILQVPLQQTKIKILTFLLSASTLTKHFTKQYDQIQGFRLKYIRNTFSSDNSTK